MPAYVTLLPGAFSDDSVAGRTVRVEEIEIEEGVVGVPHVFLSFTWPENPYDMDSVSAEHCRTANEEEIDHATREYRSEQHIPR